jgi:hypothetical protein
MKRGDHVLILCEVTDADVDNYTMMINAIMYRHGEPTTRVTQVDVLIEAAQ